MYDATIGEQRLNHEAMLGILDALLEMLKGSYQQGGSILFGPTFMSSVVRLSRISGIPDAELKRVMTEATRFVKPEWVDRPEEAAFDRNSALHLLYGLVDYLKERIAMPVAA